MTDDEIIAFLFLMVVAGNETTTKLLGNAMFHLTAAPRRSGPRCSPTPRLIARWIEETLRYDTSSQMLARHLDGTSLHGRDRAGRGRRCCCSSGPPTGTTGCSPTRTRSTSHRAEDELRQIAQLRRRAALLPRRQPRPARGAGGAARSWSRRVRSVEVDRRPRAPGPLRQRPRLRPLPVTVTVR